MKLKTLLNHSAELFRIINKSSQPADKIASQYLREKKYIGAADRRFISECVFAALRVKSLAEFCVDKCFDSDFTKNNTDLLLVYATFVISAVYGNEKSPFITADLVPKHLGYDSSDSLILVSEAFSDNFSDNFNSTYNLTNSVENNWIDCIRNALSDIIAECNKIIADCNNTITKHALADEEIELLAKRYCIQPWILKSWMDNGKTTAEACDLAESLFVGAPLCLRVNANMKTRAEVVDSLREMNIEPTISNLSPSGIIIKKRVKLDDSELYRSGAIEVQDESSQMAAFALDCSPGHITLDACAGAGGKTLHIACLQKDSGLIAAADIELKRLKQISRRASRYGYKSIKTKFITRRLKPPYFDMLFDRIIVDAPCSGMGTVRRMPMPKWRLNPKLLKKLNQNQLHILNTYSKYLKSGGLLVYSTCSLMSQENEQIAEEFLLANNEFRKADLYEIFKKQNIQIEGLDKGGFCCTLLPSVHGSDGFFISVFSKE